MENYVNIAEQKMYALSGKNLISTSKMRDLLAQVNELYNDVILLKNNDLEDGKDILPKKYVKAIDHLRVKMIYDAGRDKSSMKDRDFISTNVIENGKKIPKKMGNLEYFYAYTGLLNELKGIGNSKEKFIDYCRYFEALVAYHKYYGGK